MQKNGFDKKKTQPYSLSSPQQLHHSSGIPACWQVLVTGILSIKMLYFFCSVAFLFVPAAGLHVCTLASEVIELV